MMRSLPISVLGSEFNDFLFAPIGEDSNGMLVSVLSGLARSDVDPWQEAAKLAQLPGEAATMELAAQISALPDGAAPSFVPLEQTIDDVHQAATLINNGQYYEASQLLRQAQDGERFDVTEIPNKPSKK